MPSALDPAHAPGLHRWKLAAATLMALALLLPAAYGAQLLTTPSFPLWEPSREVHYAETDDGDYLAYVELTASRSKHLSGRWVASPAPERLLLVRLADVDTLLAGGQPAEVLKEWTAFDVRDFKPPPGVSKPHSRAEMDLSFRVPAMDCSGPQGSCKHESAPVLVWLRGDSWAGTDVRNLSVATVEYQPGNSMGWSGPVGFRGLDNPTHVVVMAPWWVGLAGAAATGAFVCGGRWFVGVTRAGRTSRRMPAYRATGGTGTDEMLRLLHVGEIYVASIARSFLTGALAIALGAVVLMTLALPPLFRELNEHFMFLVSVLQASQILFLLVVPFAVFMAFLFWGAAYLDARRELARWRRMVREIETKAEEILTV